MSGRIGALLRACAMAVLLVASPALAESYYVEGEGGVPIAVRDEGPKDAPAILFLHGITMGAESFAPQFASDLSQRFRLVAFDLRGHGLSGKPSGEEAYTDTAAWAGDVRRVIAATGIKRPVIVAWSYGTLVAADYIRHEGAEGIAGLVLVSSTGGLAEVPPPSAPPDPAVARELDRSRSLRGTPSFDAQEEASAIIAPMLTHAPPGEEWERRAKMLAMMVPPYAQAPLRRHPLANADLASAMEDLPVVVAHGEFDAAFPPAAAQALAAALPGARVHPFEDAGHSPFAEDPAAFNAMLAEFRLQTMENPQ